MKYFRKNEFRHGNSHSRIGNHEGHISCEYGNKYKVNAITHSKKFFGKKTYLLNDNPNKHNNQRDNRKSRISVPVWDKKSNYSVKKNKYWHMSNANIKIERKINKKIDKATIKVC